MVKAKGSQQNGAILGNGCALFLTRFTTSLVLKYNELLEEVVKSEMIQSMGNPEPTTFNNEVYSDALTEVLQSMAEEDMAEHGRLLCMKEVLTDMSTNKKLSE